MEYDKLKSEKITKRVNLFVIVTGLIIATLMILSVITHGISQPVNESLFEQSVLVASTSLLGFTGVVITFIRNKSVTDEVIYADISFRWSLIFSLITIIVICFWFVEGWSFLPPFSWYCFGLQLLTFFMGLDTTHFLPSKK